jgi:hypothetical protein
MAENRIKRDLETREQNHAQAFMATSRTLTKS